MTTPASPPALSQLRSALSSFTEGLRAALGEDLVSLVLYGGSARGTFDPATSDVNLMLVLRAASTDVLDRVATAAEPLRLAYRLNMMTLAVADSEAAAELFPTKFLDIERHHETLHGAAPGGWSVPRERLQRQALRQLMNLRLRLLRVYLESKNRPERLDAAVRRSITPMLLNLGVLLELKSGKPFGTPEEVVGGAQSVGLDGDSLRKILGFKYKTGNGSAAVLRDCYTMLIDLVEKSLNLGRQIK